MGGPGAGVAAVKAHDDTSCPVAGMRNAHATSHTRSSHPGLPPLATPSPPGRDRGRDGGGGGGGSCGRSIPGVIFLAKRGDGGGRHDDVPLMAGG